MNTLEERIHAFSKLGDVLRAIAGKEEKKQSEPIDSMIVEQFRNSMDIAAAHNPWFIPHFIQKAVASISEMFHETHLRTWVHHYPEIKDKPKAKTVGAIMAGNIPLVGFHDFLCVLLSGHKFLGKLSSNDQVLLPAVAEILKHIAPDFADSIYFTNHKITGFDAVIATGSNNSARYFDYYFGRYPNLIRSHRNGIAVITGKESKKELKDLADDVFMYFGLGCRNVSKIYFPEGYNLEHVFEGFEGYRDMMLLHTKYFNNYEYNKAIMLVNNEAFYDNGFVLLKPSGEIASPVSVVYFEYYKNETELHSKLTLHDNVIQCIVSNHSGGSNRVPFGHSQKPLLTDYADGIDTMKWLVDL